MARLTPTDRKALEELRDTGWRQSTKARSPRHLASTVEAREAYCRWATEAARFFKGKKSVRFGGSNWKL